jgi:uncharacterized repeat protein (TIGR03803 family)
MQRIVNPFGRVSRAKWACAVLGLCTMTAIALPAQVFTTLHSFAGPPTDGSFPEVGLIQAANRDLYGTTGYGGAYGGGTIFKVTPSGRLTTLYSFCAVSGCIDGAKPGAALVQATDGDFYGTAYFGGANCHQKASQLGCGALFKITAGGALTTLYSFCALSACADGAYPYGALVQGKDGNLYGTTSQGGIEYNLGTVFRITPAGTLTTLYSFCSQTNCTDGDYPAAALIQAADGDFYGTTLAGGANGAYDGTVFKITPGGVLTTLYSFCSQADCTDGENPHAGLVQAANGDFYGTTAYGGMNRSGTVFRMTPGGVLTTLYSFCSEAGCMDGVNPRAGLVQASGGDLYGTTHDGGANCGGYTPGCGTVFKITPAGTLATLFKFNGTDGASPHGLVPAANGDVYGTTATGGANDDGTVFNVSVELSPKPAAGAMW